MRIEGYEHQPIQRTNYLGFIDGNGEIWQIFYSIIIPTNVPKGFNNGPILTASSIPNETAAFKVEFDLLKNKKQISAIEDLCCV